MAALDGIKVIDLAINYAGPTSSTGQGSISDRSALAARRRPSASSTTASVTCGRTAGTCVASDGTATR